MVILLVIGIIIALFFIIKNYSRYTAYLEREYGYSIMDDLLSIVLLFASVILLCIFGFGAHYDVSLDNRIVALILGSIILYYVLVVTAGKIGWLNCIIVTLIQVGTGLVIVAVFFWMLWAVGEIWPRNKHNH